MDSLRIRCAPRRRAHHRQGMIAVQEVIFLVVVLIGVAWLIPQVLDIGLKTSCAAISTSSRWVTRISVNSEGRRLCQFRPKEGYFSVDLVTGDTERSLPFLPAEFIALDFSGNGSTLLLCDLVGGMTIYHDGEEAGVGRTRFNDDDFIHSLVADDGTFAACVSSNGQIDGWRQHGSEFRAFSYDLESNPAIQFVSVNSTGRRLCVVRSDGSVTFHASDTGVLDGRQFNLRPTNVGFTWSHDERTIAAITSDSLVRVYDCATGQIIREGALEGHPPHCNAAVMRISPDGKWIAATSDVTYQISVWNVSTGTIAGRLSGHRALIRTMAFSPGSDRFYSGSYDGTVREWSLDTFSQVRTIE